MERIPKAGEFYRHFKNKLYQIITVATHSESGEQMVVYQALYGDFKTYVRPLDMFTSEVDHVKYPDVQQKYRFEKVVLSENAEIPSRKEVELSGSETVGTRRAESSEEADEFDFISIDFEEPQQEVHSSFAEDSQQGVPNPYLLRFLEADTYDQKMEALAHMRGRVGQEELNCICLVLDIPSGTGSVDKQLADIRHYLETQNKYTGSRLRG